MAIDVTIITQPEERAIYGVWGKSSDKTVSKDIPALSKEYYGIVGKEPGLVLPFFVLSKDYAKDTGRFDLLIGGENEKAGLTKFHLPAGIYGKISVKPKLKLLWGLAVGEAKRFFYIKWLPASEYEAVNMEYELHTEKSIAKNPEVDLLFAIKTKQATAESTAT